MTKSHEMVEWLVNYVQHRGLPSLQYNEYQGWFCFSFYDVLYTYLHLHLFLWTYFTTGYIDRMIMTFLPYSYSWTHAYCSSSLKPVCMSHTIVLSLSWVGGAVCPSMCMRSRVLTVVAIMLWSYGLWYLQCATWLPKLQRNTPPSALNTDTVCCSSAFVPTFQTTQYHKLTIPLCQYLYIYVLLGAEIA